MGMKLAIAGKGGVGKTSLCAWMGDYLARTGRRVWLVDADTALSLGGALGLSAEQSPAPLSSCADLIRERVGSGGLINLAPEVTDLPEQLRVRVAGIDLLVMGSIAGAGQGCACAANALLKALLLHLVLEREQCVLVDLEAGVEPLGRGTVAAVDGVVIVAEPGLRSLRTAADIGRMASDLGVRRQVLVLNRAREDLTLPEIEGLPRLATTLPFLSSLAQRQLTTTSVLGLPERPDIDAACERVFAALLDQPGR